MHRSKVGVVAVLLSAVTFGSQLCRASEAMAVKLQLIETIHAQEAHGDELYFSVTEFPAKNTPLHYQIPSYPSHWLSGYLKSVKNITLWQKTLPACEDVNVVFSLVEEDFPPWNLDDLLGSVELKIKCDQGKYQTQWTIPDQAITSKIPNEDDSYSFSGKNAKYRAVFKLEAIK